MERDYILLKELHKTLSQQPSRAFHRHSRASRMSMPVMLCLLFELASSIPVHAGDGNGSARNVEFPGQHWRRVGKPEDLGWSTEKLATAQAYSNSLDTAAVMIIDDGVGRQPVGNRDIALMPRALRMLFFSLRRTNQYPIGEQKETIDDSR